MFLVFTLPGCHVSFGFCPCARDLTFAITVLRLLRLFIRLFFELLQWCQNLGHGSRKYDMFTQTSGRWRCQIVVSMIWCVCYCQWVEYSKETCATANITQRMSEGHLQIIGRGQERTLRHSERCHNLQAESGHRWGSPCSPWTAKPQMLSRERWEHRWTCMRYQEATGLIVAWIASWSPWLRASIPLNECPAWKSCAPTETFTQRKLCTNNFQGQGGHPDISEGWGDPSGESSQGSSRVATSQLHYIYHSDHKRSVSKVYRLSNY